MRAEDGTTAESAKDLSVRVLQQVSIIETLASSIDVVIVAADSDLLSVWQAAIAGAPIEGHRAFAMSPGEVRFLEYEIQYDTGDGSPPPVVLAPPPKLRTTGGNGNGNGGRYGSSLLPARMAEATRLAEAGKAMGSSAAALEKEKAELAEQLLLTREGKESGDRAKYDAEREAEAKLRNDRAAAAAEAKAAKDREILAGQQARQEALLRAEQEKRAAKAEADARRGAAAAEEAEKRRVNAKRLSEETKEATTRSGHNSARCSRRAFLHHGASVILNAITTW